MIKRIILSGAFAALAQGATAQDLRMTVWTGSEAHLGMLNGIAESFAETHPGVTVSFETIPFGDYVQKVTLQLAGGNPPDLGWLLETSAPTFVNAGVLLDVGATLKGDADYDFADLSEPAMALWESGDAVYGVPFSTSPFIVFYNATMFEEAGLPDPNEMAATGEWTWAALREAAATLSDADDGIYGFQSVDGQGYDARVMHTLMPIIRAYGGEAWSDGACTLDSPEAVEAVTLYHDMVFDDRSAVPPGEQADFFTGGAAMTVTQISRVTKLDGAGFEWGIAPLPSGPAGEAATTGQAAIVAFAQGEHPELAAEFLAYMTEKANVATMAEFFPPARTSVLDSPAFTTSNPALSEEQMGIVAQGIADGIVLPSHENYPQIEAAMRPRFDALWQPDADVAAVLGEVCAAAEPLL